MLFPKLDWGNSGGSAWGERGFTPSPSRAKALLLSLITERQGVLGCKPQPCLFLEALEGNTSLFSLRLS